MSGAGRRTRSESIVSRLPTAILLIVLAGVVLFLELPQGMGWIHKPAVLTFALPGIVLIRLGTRPRRLALFGDAILGTVFFLGSVAACRTTLELLLAAAGSLGIASLLGLGISRIAGAGQPGKNPFAAAAMLCVFSAAVGFFFIATVALAPRTYDTYLYAFDYRLGSPGFLTGRLCSEWPLLRSASFAVYLMLPFVMAACYALQLVNPKQSPLNILLEFTIGAVIGWILYIVYPAAGPIYAFPRAFPLHPPLLAAVQIGIISLPGEAARNCMPSLHATWALLVFWNSRPFSRWAKMLAAIFLVLTLTATLGLGEHYLVDLVVALPFALCIQGICAPRLVSLQRERLTALATGAGLTAAWIIALKQKGFVSGVSPMASWALVAGTVGVCLFLERRLAQRLYQTQGPL